MYRIISINHWIELSFSRKSEQIKKSISWSLEKLYFWQNLGHVHLMWWRGRRKHLFIMFNLPFSSAGNLNFSDLGICIVEGMYLLHWQQNVWNLEVDGTDVIFGSVVVLFVLLLSYNTNNYIKKTYKEGQGSTPSTILTSIYDAFLYSFRFSISQFRK